MTNLKPVCTPFVSHYKLSVEWCPKTADEHSYMDGIPYANILGLVMYMMVYIHLNIAYVVSIVNRLMSNLDRAHRQTLKWILYYLKGSLRMVIIYDKARQSVIDATIKGFVDSNFFGCLNSTKSLTDYVFTTHDITIIWKVNLYKLVLSTIKVK